MKERLLYDRVTIHGHLSQQTELSWSMRQLMAQKSFNPARLRALAEGLREAGRTDSALTLLREVLRKHPDARWAADLRRDWTEELKSGSLPIQEVK